MRSLVRISDVVFVPIAGEADASALGWITCVLDGAVQLNGLALCRAKDGSRVVSYPVQFDPRGFCWPYVAPISDAVRDEIQRQILAAIDSGRTS